MKTPSKGSKKFGCRYHPTKGWKKESAKNSALVSRGFDKIDRLIERALSLK